MKVYLSTCDKTSHILPATIFLYRKYVGEDTEFIILGFNKPVLPDWNRITFISFLPRQDNINTWTSFLHDYFVNVQEEFIFFALDDHFPIDYINRDCYDAVMEHMKNNPVGFCTIAQQPSSSPIRNEVSQIITDNDKVFIYSRKKPLNYQLTLLPGIWRREYLLRMFKTAVSPWDFELYVSNFANQDDGYYNLSTSDFPRNKVKCMIRYGIRSSLCDRWWRGINVSGLQGDIVKQMINIGLLNREDLIIAYEQGSIRWKEDIDYSIINDQEWRDLYA
jgi:hypothetical protein